jgi:hypothetical protein
MIDPRRLPTAIQREQARERIEQTVEDIRAGRRARLNITREKILAMVEAGLLVRDGERVSLPEWQYRQ